MKQIGFFVLVMAVFIVGSIVGVELKEQYLELIS